MTAGERLQQISGSSNTSAGTMFLLIGTGVTSGEILLNYSQLARDLNEENKFRDEMILNYDLMYVNDIIDIFYDNSKIDDIFNDYNTRTAITASSKIVTASTSAAACITIVAAVAPPSCREKVTCGCRPTYSQNTELIIG